MTFEDAVEDPDWLGSVHETGVQMVQVRLAGGVEEAAIIGKNVRPSMRRRNRVEIGHGQRLATCCRHDVDRLLVGGREQDAAVLRPRTPAATACGADRRGDTASGGDLAQAIAGEEANLIAVRRPERVRGILGSRELERSGNPDLAHPQGFGSGRVPGYERELCAVGRQREMTTGGQHVLLPLRRE